MQHLRQGGLHPFTLTAGQYNRSYFFDGASWSSLPSGGMPNGDFAIQVAVTGEDFSTLSDRVNNAVGIDIASPAIGSYSIRVEGYNVPQGPQPYALVVTGGTLSALTEVTPSVAPSSPTARSSEVSRGLRTLA